jgi:5-formyltetrahydrofolate cyclo-ligase
MNKEELRALYRQIRLRMTKSESSSKSRLIGRKLLNEIDWANYQNICAYTPVQSLNEVDITEAVSRLEGQGLRVRLIPPDKDAKMPIDTFDMILVPCLAFDEQRYRLGWGGGWYDKFLTDQTQALKVGLAYKDSLVPSLPREPHDIPLDIIIAEDRVY